MPRALCILLLAATALAQTTTRPATTTTSPATTQTTRPRTPTNETVTIDLAAEYGPFKPLAKGLHRLTPTIRPSAQMITTLRPLLDDPTPTLITLGNSVKFDGAFPGEKGNWSKWDQGLQELAHQHRGKPVQWEVWDEPDRKESFKGSREDFFSVWVRSHHLLKEIDPAAVLVGPSISKHDGGWIGEFLKVGKDYQAPATIVCWHEERTRADIPGHIGGTEESFWQDGTLRNHVRIGPDSATAGRYSPSDPALFLQPLHSAHRRNAWRGTTHDFAFKLTHLVTEKGEPRSLYHAYTAYAALAAEGNKEVRLSSDVTTAGLAAWNPAKRQGSAYIGRNFNRAGRFYLAGKVSLAFRNVKAKEVRVQASRIKDTGKDASRGPTLVFDTKLPIKNGEGKILLPDFASRDAYVITFTLP